ncbi:MAG: hypothetical protein ACRDQA_05940 [Nocardioidaceae bacterium]
MTTTPTTTATTTDTLVTVDRAVLTEALGYVSKAVSTRRGDLEAAGITLSTDTEAGNLTIYSQDETMTLRSTVRCLADAQMSATFSGHLLVDLVTKMTGETVRLKAGEAGVVISCGSSRYTLPVLVGTTILERKLDKIPRYPIDAGALAAAYKCVKHAVESGDSGNINLHGVQIDASGGTLILAGAHSSHAAISDHLEFGTHLQARLPADLLAAAIRGLKDHTTIGMDENTLIVDTESTDDDGNTGMRNTARLAVFAGGVMPYAKVRREPDTYSTTITVRTADIAGAADRLGVVSETGAAISIRISEGDAILGTLDSTDTETLDATISGDETAQFAIQPHLLSQAVKAIDHTEVTLHLGNGLPIRIEASDPDNHACCFVAGVRT